MGGSTKQSKSQRVKRYSSIVTEVAWIGVSMYKLHADVTAHSLISVRCLMQDTATTASTDWSSPSPSSDCSNCWLHLVEKAQAKCF